MEKNSKIRNYIKENWSGKDMEEYLAKKNTEWLLKLKEEVKNYIEAKGIGKDMEEYLAKKNREWLLKPNKDPATINPMIILTREDLVKFKSDLPIEEIGIFDFKSSSISSDEIHKAELIIFKDGEQTKELKNRY